MEAQREVNAGREEENKEEKERGGNSRGRRNRRSVGKKVQQREDKKTEGLEEEVREFACQRGDPGLIWPGEVHPPRSS